MSNPININLIKVPTAQDIILDFFNKTDEQLSDKIAFQTIDGENKRMSIKDAIKVIKKLGCWGYCATTFNDKKEINYWIGKSNKITLLADLLGHEFCHALYSNSEKVAAQYGKVASLAIEVLLKDQIIKK